MNTFVDIVDKANDWLGKVIAWLLVPMVFIVLYTAVMRYFFQLAVPWGFEMAIFCFGIHGIVGGAYCLRHDSHVNVDVLITSSPERFRPFYYIFASLVVLGVCAVMFYLSTRWAWKSTLIFERSIHGTEWNPHIWWFKWMIPLASGLMVLQSLAQLIRHFVSLSKAWR